MVTARLHPRTIDAVKERADIVDVVGEHVVLKNIGGRLWSCTGWAHILSAFL